MGNLKQQKARNKQYVTSKKKNKKQNNTHKKSPIDRTNEHKKKKKKNIDLFSMLFVYLANEPSFPNNKSHNNKLC